MVWLWDLVFEPYNDVGKVGSATEYLLLCLWMSQMSTVMLNLPGVKWWILIIFFDDKDDDEEEEEKEVYGNGDDEVMVVIWCGMVNLNWGWLQTAFVYLVH